VTRTAQSYTPEGVAQGLAGIGEGLREMAAVVREAMAERDAELRLALGIDEGVVDPRAAQALIEEPTGNHPGLRATGPGASTSTAPGAGPSTGLAAGATGAPGSGRAPRG
jgi:hypothetical protein